MSEPFNPECGKAFSTNVLNIAAELLELNTDLLVPILVAKTGAPSETHARYALGLACKFLFLLANEIEETPIEEVTDGEARIAEALDAARKKSH